MTSKFGAGLYGQTLYSAGSTVDLSGSFSFEIDFAARLSNQLVGGSGSFSFEIYFEGSRINGDFVASGSFSFTIAFLVATMQSGPLWDPDTPCVEIWGPDSLCADPGWVADPSIEENSPWAPAELCDG